MAAMAYFLGIDGGGSKTKLLLGDRQRVIAEAIVGGSNIVRLGPEQAEGVWRGGIARICAAAQINPAEIKSVCAGIAGAAGEALRRQASELLSRLLPVATIEVVGDMVIAHESALGGAAGVIVIAGTGSIAYGRDKDGQTARAGGWGFAISDEGSGYWIGVRAVTAVMAAHDAGEKTELQPRIFAHWNLASYQELVRRANRQPAPEFAQLFPLVVAAFEAGDRHAQRILVSAGAELAALAAPVIARLWPPGESVAVKLSGGVFHASEAVRRAFEVELTDAVPSVRVTLTDADPARGALHRARRLAASE